ncbi:dynamin-related protein 4C-like [Cryptomeria japonica]|uniref:dynamin-related protein 4C-like n=1 Tax=Cryptomeria japonica TaxID=3369 RepID=UPI0027DA18AD|nr:dynamin-related protein 4C-like [Cryptomeria japonica]
MAYTEERGNMTQILDSPDIENGETLSLSESYNERIRPLLDTVDTLRRLGVMKEGINLPSIVVIGDQSSGKSSVLESLTGISLPRGQGICTRVPVVVRLQNCKPEERQIFIEYNGKKRSSIAESSIAETLNSVTEEIAGTGKGIGDTPVTLNVCKPNAPDLTMIDLPGISRVPVHGQPQDMYEQISRIIMQYIAPKQNIILNVLPAAADFPACESIKMSQRVDKKGERTLAVVTKVDKAPKGVLEKVTDDAVNIGFEYVCVRNRVGNETNFQARQMEYELFTKDPDLSKIDKTMVGIPVLAQKLIEIQMIGISKRLPKIVKNIDVTLSKRQSELNALPRNISNSGEAMIEFMRLMDSIKCILHKLVVQGGIELFSAAPEMHCIACLHRMFESYSHDLSTAIEETPGEFLAEEVKLMEEAQGISLHNSLPHSVLASLIQSRIEIVSERSRDIAIRACEYIDKVVCRVIDSETQCYPLLHSASRRAFQALIDRKKEECIQFVLDSLQKQKTIFFTMNPGYLESQQNWQGLRKTFMKAIKQNQSSVMLKGIGEINLQTVPKGHNQLEAAFEMKMSVMAYWSMVKMRLADEIPLHLRFTFHQMVQNDIVNLIVKEVVGTGESAKMGDILEESPITTTKRRKLLQSVDTLRESKSTLSEIIGKLREV